ncbi:MAG: PEP-utilizing enzyme [Candidatus Lokiarchaeota archaeon]
MEAKIRNQRLGFLKWKLFSIILNFSKKYIIFRETQRFNLDKWITRNRRVYLKIGNIFYQYGILEDPIDVFFLRRVEIKNLINNHTEKEKISKIKQKVKERSDKFKEYENSLPPKFLYGSREFNDILEYDKYSKVFRGIPASQGIRIGRVRVLNTIENISNVHPDDILIVPRTDPGWTPVFSKIGGLITETGGVLSHGAVVSREYGIPAVTNITNACKIFQTGQKVKINGYNGEIRILKK